MAARVIDAVPDVMNIPKMVTDNLLNSAGATAIVYRRNGKSQLIELDNAPMPRAAVTADMRSQDPMTLIAGAIDTLAAGDDRTLRIVGDADGDDSHQVEVLMPEAPLRSEMLVYSRNIALISLIIAALTAVVIFVLLSRILIAPIRRVTANMVGFRQAPENASLIIQPSRRRDEIGVVEQELAAMETDLFSMLKQRRHLADLGLAVAKINHDLRNTLTSAQLLSDQVANLDDPKVQRLAPRLVHTLDKAIGFAQSVLDYGRQSGAPPRPVPVDLKSVDRRCDLRRWADLAPGNQGDERRAGRRRGARRPGPAGPRLRQPVAQRPRGARKRRHQDCRAGRRHPVPVGQRGPRPQHRRQRTGIAAAGQGTICSSPSRAPPAPAAPASASPSPAN